MSPQFRKKFVVVFVCFLVEVAVMVGLETSGAFPADHIEPWFGYFGILNLVALVWLLRQKNECCLTREFESGGFAPPLPAIH